MPDDGGSDDSDDEDCDDINDYVASEIRRLPRSRKRVKRAKDTETNDVDTASTHSLNVAHQATAAISSARMQESEEIPIYGYLKLKTINSEVVYCLTFFQHPSPEPGISQRHSISRSVSSSSDRRDSEQLPSQEHAACGPLRKLRFSPQEDALLLQLKGEGLSWDEIWARFSKRFPNRSKGTLQVHYCTRLKPQSDAPKRSMKRRRSK